MLSDFLFFFIQFTTNDPRDSAIFLNFYLMVGTCYCSRPRGIRMENICSQRWNAQVHTTLPSCSWILVSFQLFSMSFATCVKAMTTEKIDFCRRRKKKSVHGMRVCVCCVLDGIWLEALTAEATHSILYIRVCKNRQRVSISNSNHLDISPAPCAL